MKNKLLIMLILFVAMFAFFPVVAFAADTYTCVYDIETEKGAEKNEQISIKFDLSSENFMKVTDCPDDYCYTSGSADDLGGTFYAHYPGENYMYTKGDCPLLYLIVYESGDGYVKNGPIEWINKHITGAYYMTTTFFTDNYARSMEKSKIDSVPIGPFEIPFGELWSSENKYNLSIDPDSDENKGNRNVSICPTLSDLMKELTDDLSSYKNCKDDISCKTDAKGKFDNKLDTIKEYCNNALATRDIYPAADTADQCITFCLQLDDSIKSMEEDAGMDVTSIKACNLSEKLIAWILKIFRWLKYLAPAAVILLGILDFGKAIASDKEDEMKKAQKNFVTRLIVAALIFIAPIVIEFIVSKFGFLPDGCGIIKL